MIVLLTLLLIDVFVLFLSTDCLSNFGSRPRGDRLRRIEKSAHFNGEMFVNPVETSLHVAGGFWKMAFHRLFGHEQRVPKGKVPVEKIDPKRFERKPADRLRATWMGHSTVLLEIDGNRILMDPIWSKRSSPSSLVGPARFYEPPISLRALPQLDAVLISHDHYDHLDKHTVQTLAATGVQFIVPLGVGAHLEKWGIDQAQIVELDWWEQAIISGGKTIVVATPARHFSGRALFWLRNTTLWTSFAIIGQEHRVFFSGDTGMFPGLKTIGDRFGPFDMAMLEIGAYDERWKGVHIGPEGAAQAAAHLRSQLLLPLHYATFELAFHDWNEPPRRLVKAAQNLSIKCAIPKPGQSVTTVDPPPLEPWWEVGD